MIPGLKRRLVHQATEPFVTDWFVVVIKAQYTVPFCQSRESFREEMIRNLDRECREEKLSTKEERGGDMRAGGYTRPTLYFSADFRRETSETRFAHARVFRLQHLV